MSDQTPFDKNTNFPSRPADRRVVTISHKQVGGSVENTFRVDKPRIVIGSVVSADVRIAGEGVSPIHAVIETGPEMTLYDLASDTGVFVNRNKAIHVGLKEGDEIQIGKNILTVGFESLEKALKTGPHESMEGGRSNLFRDGKEDLAPLLLTTSANVEEIFDYRPTSKSALEVVMSWFGTILNVEHFVDVPQVTIGSERKSHFGVPALLSSSYYALVTQSGSGYLLNLDPQMRGVIQSQGQLRSIKDLIDAKKESGASLAIPLGKDDFAKVSVGDVDFYLSYTAAPPALKRSRLFEKDPLFLRIAAVSLVLTAALLATLLSMEPAQQIEAEEIPERIATILYQPEKFPTRPIPKVEKKPEPPTPVEKPKVEEKKPEPPKPKPTTKVDLQMKKIEPKPIPKELSTGKQSDKNQTAQKAAGAPGSQNEAKEGAGAKAKGESGVRGQKNAPKFKENQDQANRPSPHGGEGRGSGNSEIKSEGNLDILKGASGKIQDLLGNSAAQLGKGGEKLKGFGGFTTAGNGGLALSGSGKGGGGTADSLGGLADKGQGGGRVGTGLGAAGNGSGIVGGRTRVALQRGGAEEVVVEGAIDTDAILAAILAHKDEFRLCYEKELNAPGAVAKNDLGGTVSTQFTIGSSGKVTEAGVNQGGTSLKDENVQRCIVRVLKDRVNFPSPAGGGVVEVKFPFRYAATGAKN